MLSSEAVEQGEAVAAGGKRHVGDPGVKLLAVGFYVNRDNEQVKAGDAAAAVWEGLSVNVPATEFREEDPQGYYAGNVRAARHAPSPSASSAQPPKPADAVPALRPHARCRR